MDINLHSEVKGYGMPSVPAMEREERNRPPVTPVADSSSSAGTRPDDRSSFDKGAGRGEGGKALSPEDAEKLAQEMQARLDSIGNTRLNFSIHRDPEAVVVQVTDRQSGEVIRQFPAEQSLELRRKLNELVGMMLDSRV